MEEYEPRLMYSVDAAPHALLLANGTQPAEQRVIDAQGDYVGVQSAAVASGVELVIVDAAVEDKNVILNQIDISNGRTLEVITLDADGDGVDQISAALAGRSDIAALHIVSHGADGELQLGNTLLDASQLAARSAEIARWGDALNYSADILLYGCDVAADAKGEAFVRRLSALTRADVAASNNVTGNAKFGGDWKLEYAVGRIDGNVIMTAGGQALWQGTLAALTVRAVFAMRV